VCLDFTFKDDKLRRMVRYEPSYSRDGAVAETVAWFREHWAS
jgi:nucleoside-diphosphate-sugar epimerase